MAENKVKFGLKNVHYAMITETVSTSGTVTTSYGDVKAIAGAVSLSMSSNADRSVFRADDSDYFVSYGQGGYEGDLEIAKVNEDFMKDVLSYKEDDDGILVESSDDFKTTKYFALMFEFDGDQKHIRHVLYNCAASRPGIEGKTNEDSREVQTETLTIKATPLASGIVKAKTGNTTDTTVYNDWYKAVYMPTVAEAEEGEGVA